MVFTKYMVGKTMKISLFWYVYHFYWIKMEFCMSFWNLVAENRDFSPHFLIKKKYLKNAKFRIFWNFRNILNRKLCIKKWNTHNKKFLFFHKLWIFTIFKVFAPNRHIIYMSQFEVWFQNFDFFVKIEILRNICEFNCKCENFFTIG